MIKGSTLDYIDLNNKIKIYYGLVNEGFSDNFNRYKKIKVIENIPLPFTHTYRWDVVKVQVERCNMRFTEYLILRNWCGDTYGFDFLNGCDDLTNITFGEIKFKFKREGDDTCGYILETNECLKYNMTRWEIVEDVYNILKYLRERK